MWTRRTPVVALAAVAALAGATAAGTAASGPATDSLAATYTATPVGPGCDAVPSEGEGSFAGMADDPVGTAAANRPDLSTFVAAVQASGLADALNSEGPFTVFAPIDAAFERIPTNVLDSIMVDTELLDSILTYHVVSGEALDAETLAAAGTVTTAHGAAVSVSQEGDTLVLDGESAVTCGPIPVANGFVYLIDAVLQPPSDDLGVGATTIVDGSVIVLPGGVTTIVDGSVVVLPATSAPDPTVIAQPGE